MTENPYDPPQIALAQDLGRTRYRFRIYHAIAICWSMILLGSSLYLSQVEQLPEQYRARWPLDVELFGEVLTIIVMMPIFCIRVLYLLVRRRFGEGVIDAAFAGAVFIALCFALIIHPVTD
jgi:hypothetical protein